MVLPVVGFVRRADDGPSFLLLLVSVPQVLTCRWRTICPGLTRTMRRSVFQASIADFGYRLIKI